MTGSIVAQPRTTVNIVNASEAVQNTAQQVLIVGQKVAAGSATAGALVQNILNDNSEDTLFGQNSMIAAMIRAFKKENKITQVDAIALDDDGSGVAATGTIVIVGTATAAGTLTVTVGSEKNHTYSIAVANGDTATVIGDAIEAAVLADLDNPCTAANVTGTVTMTADNDGTVGNEIGLAISGTVAGVTHSTTAMSGGATDPTLTNIFDVVGNKRYQTIVWPWALDTSELRTFLDARFNVTNAVQDGVGITCMMDTLSNHNTRLAALNSQSLVFIVDKIEAETSYNAPAQNEWSPVKSAIMAGIRSLRLTDGASISQYVITANGPSDSFGGAALSSKPYFNTTLPNLPLIDIGRGWNDTEIEQLFDNGGSIFGVNSAGNTAIMGEIVTTYKTDSAANPDISFKFLNYVDTVSNGREYYFNNLRARFAQSRLTTGDVIRGRDMANDLTIINFCEKLYQDLSGPDFVITQAGEDAVKFFKDNISVTLDIANGKATILMDVPIVTQLREIVATFKIVFTPTS
jgi:phage tail sheath gpL-like